MDDRGTPGVYSEKVDATVGAMDGLGTGSGIVALTGSLAVSPSIVETGRLGIALSSMIKRESVRLLKVENGDTSQHTDSVMPLEPSQQSLVML